jgi:exopolysaccharide biosynthesis predicted pyruvyltransferase EpsI
MAAFSFPHEKWKKATDTSMPRQTEDTAEDPIVAGYKKHDNVAGKKVQVASDSFIHDLTKRRVMPVVVQRDFSIFCTSKPKSERR